MTTELRQHPHSVWYTDELLPDDFIKLLPRKTVYGFNVGSDVLLVAGMHNLRRQWSDIKLDPAAMVVVFDTASHTKKWGLPKLDTSKPVMTQLKTCTLVKLTVSRTTPITKLLAKTAKSFVSNFLTLSYKYPEPEAVRVSVLTAIASDNVPRLVQAIPTTGHADLIALVKSDDATNLTTAIALFGKGRSVVEAAKQTGVSTFDILYVTKFVARVNAAK